MVTFSAVGVLAIGLFLFAGLATGSSFGPAGATPQLAASTATSSSNTTFNFSQHAPVWDSGNLCVVQESGHYWSCEYSGYSYGYRSGHTYTSPDCGCSAPNGLIYNFSINRVVLNISLSNLSGREAVYINVEGNHNTINLNVSGCGKGGILNVTVLGEFDQVNFQNSANGVRATFAIYQNHDGYSAQISGFGDRTSTTFALANTKLNECGWRNATRGDDTWSVAVSGWGDYQAISWVNAQGYNSGPAYVSLGYGSYLSFTNTTTFSCYWSLPSSTGCHHGGNWDQPLVAAVREQ